MCSSDLSTVQIKVYGSKNTSIDDQEYSTICVDYGIQQFLWAETKWVVIGSNISTSFIHFGAESTTTTNSGVRYLYPGGSSSSAASSATISKSPKIIMPFSGIVTSFYITQNSGTGTTGSDYLTISCIKNSISVSFSTTVDVASTSQQNVSETLKFTAGDTLAIRSITTNSGTLTVSPKIGRAHV